MTISNGFTGGSVLGVVFGTAAAGSPVAASAPANAAPQAFTGGGAALHTLGQLPMTGATHLMVMFAVALVSLVAGLLVLGLVRRGGDEPLGA